MPDRWRRRAPLDGGVVLLLLVVTALILRQIYQEPSAAVRHSQQRIHCARNLGRIGVALLAYAERHGDGHRFPASLDALFEHGMLDSEQLLRCPASAKTYQTPSGRHSSYDYRGGLSLLMPMETVLIYESGAPHRGSRPGEAAGYGLRTDLGGMSAPAPDGTRGWAEVQRGPLRLLAGDRTRLLDELTGGPPYNRELAAWQLWHRGSQAAKALRVALRDRDPEVRMYAGLALLEDGHTDGMRALLETLLLRTPNSRGGRFLIEGPRRRIILSRLAANPRARPVTLFAYDTVHDQQLALRAWLGKWAP